ncbi:hypothetical protein [Mucilaginibacter agri]|uniref:Uncharacterized protein n=1 Tax=Mucilaginibacter agri TaxID=2695265 RepID=A0A965ZLU4_9SPHI|nr:hypothetical protein [Mucilaginibacter agri]NCD72061.1 hypothetical protein [Mucilaginibacter agri]
MRAAYLKCHSYLNIVCVAVLFFGAPTFMPHAYYHVIGFNASTRLAYYKYAAVYTPAHCGETLPQNTCTFPATLTADPDAPYWLWNTGETTQSISVSSPGIYSWQTANMHDDVVVDGSFTGFNAANPAFISDYVYKIPAGSGTLYPEGAYTVGTNPNAVHDQFTSLADHTNNTTDDRNMMIVNGADVKNKIIWSEKNLVVKPNTTYIFSVWCTSVSSASINNPAQLLFSINNVLQNQTPISPTTTLGQWINFTTTWQSKSNTKVTISIVNQNITGGGNDFALDDIIFAPLCTTYINLTNTVPPTPTITPR